ncbi:hypothetical protein [Natranaerobius trueperi]|uniref:Uncharacterized protein n=1 Tax=Natranaerobius trueperi TaxID=759412 RepID=A0A226BV38_9FIRM|nr:hypothetical protein [Natranaerobius trueperi]OWZ82741.1 hypothetical protein CDO51_12490 [Natranaerobius trueperi]
MYQKKILNLFVFLLIVMFSISPTFAEEEEGVKSVDRTSFFTYELVPVPANWSQILQFDYEITGNNLEVYNHYNSGLQYSYPGNYLFSWEVNPFNFEWTVNGITEYEFDNFEDYPSIFPPNDAPWGGRNETTISLDLSDELTAEIESRVGSSQAILTSPASRTITYEDFDSLENMEITEVEKEDNEKLENLVEQKDSIIESFKDREKEIAAVVNDEEIYRNEILLEHELRKVLEDEEMDIEQILDERIKNKVLYEKAKENDLIVSEERARSYAEETRNKIKEDSDLKEQEILLETIYKSLNLTEEEYWNFAIDRYQKHFSINSLKEQKNEFDFNNLKNQSEFDIEIKMNY